MDAVLRALVDANRRRILELVDEDELSAGEIAAHFDVSRSAVSQHLGVLKEAGLLSERREGTRRLYAVRPEGLTDVRAFLEAFWTDSLGRLKHAAEREERRGERAANRN